MEWLEELRAGILASASQLCILVSSSKLLPIPRGGRRMEIINPAMEGSLQLDLFKAGLESSSHTAWQTAELWGQGQTLDVSQQHQRVIALLVRARRPGSFPQPPFQGSKFICCHIALFSAKKKTLKTTKGGCVCMQTRSGEVCMRGHVPLQWGDRSGDSTGTA